MDTPAYSKKKVQIRRPHLVNVGRAEFTCRFQWAPGSVATWDNRAVQHCATADFWPHRPVIEQVTIFDYDLSKRLPFFEL